MEKPVPLEQMSPEEQATEIDRRWRVVWRIIIKSHERRKREAEEASSVPQAS